MALTIRVTGCSVRYGEKFRKNQNVHLGFNQIDDGVDGDTTTEELRELVSKKFAWSVRLDDRSKITIVNNLYKK